MGMHKGKFIYATIYLMVLFSLTGCGGKLGVTARDDGKADVALFMDTGKAASAMIGSIMAALYPSGSSGAQGAVFTPERAAALQKSLSGGDLEAVKAEALSPSVLSLDATLKAAAARRSGGKAGVLLSSLVRVEGRGMTLTLSPEVLRGLYDSMDEQTRGYVDLFMAPAFTGERMDAAEYAALVASVYGKDLADELSSAVMELSLAVPKGKKALSASSGAKVAGRRASFQLPLLDLLVLTEERSYSVSW